MNNIATIASMGIKNILTYFGCGPLRSNNRQQARPIQAFPLVVHDYFERKSTPGLFFIQIGANGGAMADPIRPLVYALGNCRGVLVEPDPVVLKALKENYSDQPDVEFDCAAISDSDGVATLCSSGGCREHAAAAPLESEIAAAALSGPGNKQDGVQVKTMTLNTLFIKHNVWKVDVLQVDARGCDYDILVQLLTKTSVRPAIIRFDHSLMNRLERAHCRQLLSQAGYEVLPVGIETVAMMPDATGRSSWSGMDEEERDACPVCT